MRLGFFSEEQLKEDPRHRTDRPLSCVSCGLYRNARSPYMPPYGQFDKRIQIVGEAPGKVEDRRGKPWQGKAGIRLETELERLGVDLFEDCLSTNAVNCRPPDNRAPTDHEIACCWVKIINPTLAQYQPRVVILFGGSAISSVLGHRWPKDLGSVSRWRGWTIPDRELGAWICPMFHPSYVEREEKRKEVTTIWRQDLKRVLSKVDVPPPTWKDERSLVQFPQSEDDLLSILQRIARGKEGDLASFDYETTGLRPYTGAHRIVCASVTTARATYAFMWPKSKQCLQAWKHLLRSNRVGKIAHNMQFEHMWSQVYAGVEVQNWAWDSMQAAHILDNRPKITGLKFQAFVHFGLVGYDSKIESYLRSVDPKNSNSPNRIEEFIERYGEREVLTYCGIDSLLAWKLAALQMDQLGTRK